MKPLLTAVLVTALPLCAIGQNPTPAETPIRTEEAPPKVEVYYGGKDVNLPQLLPPQGSLTAVEKCHDNQEGSVELSLIVDANGLPRSIIFIRPLGNPIDELVLRTVEADRFQPGTLRGSPVAVERTVTVHFEVCTWRTKGENGKDIGTIRFESRPVQEFGGRPQNKTEAFHAALPSAREDDQHLSRVGGKVSPPKPIIQPMAQYSDYAKEKRIEGTSVVNLVVDAHGMPQNVHVTRSLEESLDEQAVFAVRDYRFIPAMEDGKPVPVMVSVEVRFHLR